MTATILTAEQHWTCPNCALEDVTHFAPDVVASRFHPCPGLNGITAPMVPAGTRCKVEAVERGDYINGDLVTVDGAGRPIMQVLTTRDEGNDVAVFAPCATGSARKDNQ